MPRRAAAHDSSPDRMSVPSWVRALPWATIGQAGFVIGRRWAALSAKDRARLLHIARESRGSIGNLSLKQRAELRMLAGRLDVKGIGRELLPLARRGGRGRGRRRRCRTRA